MFNIIIPIYNEANNLKNFLTQLDQYPFEVEAFFIFVDDFSIDDSLEILRSFNFKNLKHKILTSKSNMGKGAALRRGIEEAEGDYIAIQDADFEYTFSDLNELMKFIANNEIDVVYGSRFKKDNFQVHRTFHYMVNRLLTFMSNFFSGLYLSDMETCYKVFRSEIIKNIKLESNRFGFEPEVTAKLARLNVKVAELPIKYFPRSYLEGKKITWKDGVAAIWHIIKFNLFNQSNQECFKKDMPSQYILNKRKWL